MTDQPEEPRTQAPEDAKPLVLLVESDPEWTSFLGAALAGEYETTAAPDGAMGLAQALALKPDLIVTAVNLPQLSGDQLVRAVRAHPELDNIPIIVVSVRSESALRVNLLLAGAQDYVVKPVPAEELSARVGNLIAMRRTRKLLQDELASQSHDLALLATKLVDRQHELQAAVEALRASKGHFGALFDSALDAMIVVDDAREFVDANAAACHLLAASRAQIVGQRVDDFATGADNASAEEMWRSFIARGHQSGEFPLARRDQAPRYVEFTAKANFIPGRHLAIMRDITERKRVEEECNRLLEREQCLRAEAEAANRAKDEFLATLSHELRTPLGAILVWTGLLRAGKLDAAKTERALETIERNTRLQSQLIEELLDVSRITTGKLHLDLRPLAVTSAIEAAVDAIRPAADAKGVRIDLLLDPWVSPVLGDAARLQQVVWNLLSNAVKFTPAGGCIAVELRQGDAGVQIRVSDSGKGISPEFLPHVFDRFRQADSSSTRLHGGLGLGLAIVRHLVELHGGSVQATSPGDGQGATFIITLPALPARLARDGEAVTRPTPAPGLHGIRVVVVDDSADARDYVSAALEQLGASVTAVASVSEALQTLPLARPHVLISDIAMPGEDGYAMIRKLRALQPARGGRTPAVALTAYAHREDRTRALLAGYQMHLSKPVDAIELATVVAKLALR